MTNLDQDADRLLEWARDMSASDKPPWWKFRDRARWRRHRQPGDFIEALSQVLVGEVEPVRRVGVNIDR